MKYGSTSGIGIGIARTYVAEGAKVVVCGRRVEKGRSEFTYPCCGSVPRYGVPHLVRSFWIERRIQ